MRTGPGYPVCCGVFLSFLSAVSSRGNPECWSNGFNYDMCCDLGTYGPAGNVNCWDTVFTHEYCCTVKTEIGNFMPSDHSYKTGLIGRESAVTRDRQKAQEAEKIGKISECQIQWGWALNVKWGAPMGQYPECSGVPLRHMGSGWDGQNRGDYRGCMHTGGRFFLTQLDFHSEPSNSKDYRMYFGFCAPGLCSVEQVANELVPDYVIQVADSRRLMMTMGSVELWEWPHFLDTVYASASQDKTLRQQIDEVSFQVQVSFVSIACLVIVATLCDSNNHEHQSHACNGKQDMQHVRSAGILNQLATFMQHFVHAFSAKSAWKELWSPSRGNAIDFLRGIATLLLVSLHLEMAQNETMDGALEGGNQFRISLCFRCVIIMTVLTLHLALGSENHEGEKVGSPSLLKVFKSCSLKLARKFLRHLPLIMLSVWWDRRGSRFAFLNQPLNYIDGTQSTVEGPVLQWTQQGGECMKSYWTCVLRFFTINWQVRDANERVLACFGLFFLRAAGLARVTHGILYIWAVLYYAIRESGPESRLEWEKLHHDWNYYLTKRLEIPAFLGLFLAAQNMAAAAALPKRFTKRAGLAVATASWFWSSWINQNDPAQWCLARNVKKSLGDVPFVLGLCVLLRTGLPGTQSIETESNDGNSSNQGMITALFRTMTLISRLSFCILVAEAPIQSFLLRGISESGVPLTRSLRIDPMWERIILGPGLLLSHVFLALLLFMMVQRPVEVFLKPLLKTPLVESLLHGLLPLYVAFLAYHSTEL